MRLGGSLVWLVWLACSLRLSNGIRVAVDVSSAARAATTHTKEPDASLEQPQNVTAPVQRTASLQSIRPIGYTFDDADDVIHIIEPPQHFQLLKRRVLRGGGSAGPAMAAIVWEQQPKVRITRPQLANVADAADDEEDGDDVQGAMKVKEPLHPTKVVLPHKMLRGKKTAAQIIALGNGVLLDPMAMPMPMPKPKLMATTTRRRNHAQSQHADLLTQESHLQPAPAGGAVAEAQLAHLAFPAGLPLQILASVRNTQRFLHKPTTQQQVQLLSAPHGKQRIKTLKTHTVIMDKRFEREHMQRGKERQLLAQKLTNTLQRKSRVPRDLREDDEPRVAAGMFRYSTAPTPHLVNPRRNNEISERALPPQRNENRLSQEKGVQLLERIAELLKKASHYLPDEDEITFIRQSPGRTGRGTTSAGTLLEELQVRFHQDTRPKQLVGEMQSRPTIATLSGREGAPATDTNFYRFVEMSVNATDELMRGIEDRKSSPLNTTQTCGSTAFGRIDILQQLHHKIECMRLKLLARKNSKLPEQEVEPPNTNQQNRSGLNAPNVTVSSDISATLLYADVMTNIRNMLQARNLHVLDEDGSAEADTNSRNQEPFDAVAPRFVPETELKEHMEFKDLNQYVHALQQAVYQLPRRGRHKNSTLSNDATANLTKSDWYLINGEGQIYQTPLEGQLKATATLFHSFPDIPDAEFYFSKHGSEQQDPEQV